MFLHVAITPDSTAYLLHNVAAALQGKMAEEQQEAVEMEGEGEGEEVVVVVALALPSELRQPSSIIAGIFSLSSASLSRNYKNIHLLHTYVC